MAAIQVTHRPAPSLDHQQQADDPHNDSLPKLSRCPSSPTLPPFCNTKRDLDERIGNSSDTPLFSSDDLPASAEDYFAHRNKRQRKGPWWGHERQEGRPLARQKTKRQFKRNMDSGVWMGSDTDGENEPDTSEEGHAQPADSLHDLALRTFEEPDRFEGPVFPYWEDQPANAKYFWHVQKDAAQYVGKCIDEEKDTIDLSNRGLTKLHGSILESLQFFLVEHRKLQIKRHNFQDFGPNLKVFLANNLFTRVPGQLMRLENLTVLSLRGNKLTELPPAIGNLLHLRELNVGSNNLRWLPYEIRGLLNRQLRLFGFQPNPFIRPMPRYKTCSWVLEHFFCSSKPALLHSDGTLAHDSPPSPTKTSSYWPGAVQAGYVEQEVEHSPKVPSLFEVCLRNLFYSPQLSQLPFVIPDDAPTSLIPALKHTWHVKQEGDQRCTICETPFIVPRTEWIEWWQLSTKGKAEFSGSDDQRLTPADMQLTSAYRHGDAMLIGSPIPLLRRGCSWACLPKSALNPTGWSPAKGVATDEHLSQSSPRSRSQA